MLMVVSFPLSENVLAPEEQHVYSPRKQSSLLRSENKRQAQMFMVVSFPLKTFLLRRSNIFIAHESRVIALHRSAM
jgi:hypothetical protein